jgi:hypothetical protein
MEKSRIRDKHPGSATLFASVAEPGIFSPGFRIQQKKEGKKIPYLPAES